MSLTFTIFRGAMQLGCPNTKMNPQIINYYWNAEIPDFVQQACKNKSNLDYNCLWGTKTVQGITIVWIVFGYTVTTEINTQPVLWNYEVFAPKSLFKNKDFYKCIDWLCQQEELTLCLPYDPINSVNLLMLKGQHFKLFQQAVTKTFNSDLLSFGDNSISLEKLYDDVFEDVYSLAREKTKQMYSRINNPSEARLQTLKYYLKNQVYFDISSEQQRTINRLLSEDSLSECKLYIDNLVAELQHQSLTELNTYLTLRGTDTWGEFLRDYSFLYLSQQISQQLKHTNNMIPLGLDSAGNWYWRPISENTDSFSYTLRCANQHRYLLDDVWNKVITPNDDLIPVSEKLISSLVVKAPEFEVFKEIENILRLAVLERQYGIVQPSAIIIGNLGLDKIIFYPAPDTTKYKFKIVIYKNSPKGTNQVLVGRLDATSKKLEFVGANTTNSAVQNYLQMLLFIVAIAYRDLLVCRNIIKQQGKPIDTNSKNTSSKPRKIETIRYLPRIKRQIDKTFADPTRFVKTLKKVAPHIRTEHFRKLPPGHKPSDKARELAALYGYLGDFPIGETFVSPSTIGEGKLEEIQASVAQFRSLSLLELFFSES